MCLIFDDAHYSLYSFTCFILRIVNYLVFYAKFCAIIESVDSISRDGLDMPYIIIIIIIIISNTLQKVNNSEQIKC